MEHNHLHNHAAALPAQMPPESQLADVAELFKIFGDLTRVRIIFVLFQHEECVMDIAQKLEMTQSAISHQLRVLKQSRLVTSRREGKTIFYALVDAISEGADKYEIAEDACISCGSCASECPADAIEAD